MEKMPHIEFLRDCLEIKWSVDDEISRPCQTVGSANTGGICGSANTTAPKEVKGSDLKVAALGMFKRIDYHLVPQLIKRAALNFPENFIYQNFLVRGFFGGNMS
jgi:hypothetical protein